MLELDLANHMLTAYLARISFIMVSPLRQLATILALLSITLATPLEFSSTNATQSPYVELFRERTASGGELIWSGLPESAALSPIRATLGRSKDCFDTGHIECDTESNLGRDESCEALRDMLHAHSHAPIKKGSKQICYQGGQGDYNNCCVSWHNKLKGVRKSDLAKKVDMSTLQVPPFPPPLLAPLCTY